MRKAEKVLKSKKFIKADIEGTLSSGEAQKAWDRAKELLQKMYDEHEGLPKGVAAHTDQMIFPAAAIYLALKEVAPDKAYDIMKESMKKQAMGAGQSYAKMAKIPGFKKFFLGLFGSMSRKMFGESAGFKNVIHECPKGKFKMDIMECPYNKYLTEVGCPELNVLFCDNDVYAYGNIPGMKFTRTKTIGAGDELCDFEMEVI